jgi:hypothetical protein
MAAIAPSFEWWMLRLYVSEAFRDAEVGHFIRLRAVERYCELLELAHGKL